MVGIERWAEGLVRIRMRGCSGLKCGLRRGVRRGWLGLKRGLVGIGMESETRP